MKKLNKNDLLYTDLLESIEKITNDATEGIVVLEDCIKIMECDKSLLEDKTEDVLKKIQPFLDNPTAIIDGYKAISNEIKQEINWSDEKGVVAKIVAFIKGVIKWLYALIKNAFGKVKNFIIRAIGGVVPEKVTEKVGKLETFLKRMVPLDKNTTLELLGKPQKTNKFTIFTINDKKNMGEIIDGTINEGLVYESIIDELLNEAIVYDIGVIQQEIQDAENKKNSESDPTKKQILQSTIDALKSMIGQGGSGSGTGNQNPNRQENRRDERKDRGQKEEEKPNIKNIVVFDLKSELYGLKQLTDHFLSVYDNAYGTNHENLFGVSDLEMIVELFVNSINDLRQGRVKSYDTRSGYVEIKPIEASAVRDNLIRTQTNLSSLRNIFQQSHDGIQNIGRLINAKQMQALSASPQIYKFLSMESYGNIKQILDVISPRIDEAKDMERELDITKKKFEAVAKELESMAPALNSMGNVTYLPEHQKRTVNLLQSSKYLVQTTQLRLGAVTLYIRYLEEIFNLLQALSVGGSEFVKEFKLKW